MVDSKNYIKESYRFSYIIHDLAKIVQGLLLARYNIDILVSHEELLR